MAELSKFQLVSGSVTGAHHLRLGENNQDALAFHADDKMIVGVVCDGCGAGKYSEIGSRIGSQLFIQHVRSLTKKLYFERRAYSDYTEPKIDSEQYWKLFCSKMIESLSGITGSISGKYSFHPLNYPQYIRDYFLFTIVAFVMTPETTVIVSLGDGFTVMNDELLEIPSLDGNHPPYISYQLISDHVTDEMIVPFKIHYTIPTDQVRNILISTDGLRDINKKQDQLYPGKKNKVGTVHDLIRNENLYKNGVALQRHLFGLTQSRQLVDWEKQTMDYCQPILSDDTTMIMLRAKNEG